VIIVDDGSCAETKQALAETLNVFPCAAAVMREQNGGKGAAVITGLEKALEMGLTHVLQIDADGQHDAGRAGFFLEMAARFPQAAICGVPEYENAPGLRRNGRLVANTWIKIVTLSNAIPDCLCGFRVYPVETLTRLIRRHFFDKRMGFDPEILARLYWAGVPLLFYPVAVRYPEDGVSHFRMVEDNIRISLVFTRLFLGMIVRLPALLLRKPRPAAA
jgi:glycosyltransferase involved in cell wall biosynthesis